MKLVLAVILISAVVILLLLPYIALLDLSHLRGIERELYLIRKALEEREKN